MFTIDNLVYSDLFELEKVDGMHFDSISEAFKILKNACPLSHRVISDLCDKGRHSIHVLFIFVYMVMQVLLISSRHDAEMS